jgi:glucosamine--fructose-6-phosphate aminotransferase (isomerizing)
MNHFVSSFSAIVEHTKQVVFLEDGDVAYINHDQLTIHRINGTVEGITTDQIRAIQTLTMEIQEIMKGEYSSFMKKEIFEQPESVVNTMRGRVIMPGARIVLGGIKVKSRIVQVLIKVRPFLRVWSLVFSHIGVILGSMFG